MVSGDITNQVFPLDISWRKLAAGASEFPHCYRPCSRGVQERHQPADVTASELDSPDTDVGVDLRRRQSSSLHMGEGGRKPAWEPFLFTTHCQGSLESVCLTVLQARQEGGRFTTKFYLNWRMSSEHLILFNWGFLHRKQLLWKNFIQLQ